MSASLRSIRFIGFDFDGVFTDNRVYVAENGAEMVVCNRSDGQGLARLRELGVEFAIFSTEKNPVVKHRAAKLGVDCYSGLEDKGSVFLAELQKRDIPPAQAAFLGNDINDLSCLRAAGFAFAVADAFPEILEPKVHRLAERGGHGAVRELCDLIHRAYS